MASVGSASGGEPEDIERGNHVAAEMVPSPNFAFAKLSSSHSCDDSILISEDQVTPLLAQSRRSKVNISPSYYKRKPVEGIILSFTTPIMASIVAIIILQEQLRMAKIGGLAYSFFGLLFIFRPMLTTQEEASNSQGKGNHHVFAVVIGLFSSVVRGIGNCFTRAGAKVADQLVLTVFSFGLLGSPTAATCALAFEDLVLPSLHIMLLMVLLGSLAFFAEITLARGLQLEKTSKLSNLQYLEAAISQLIGMSLSRLVSTFGGLVGCLLILLSVFCTIYIGPEKEIE